MTHYALRVDYPDLNLIKDYFKNYTNVFIGPIEYKKRTKIPHIHMAFDYERLTVRQENDKLRNPMITNGVITKGKYSLKEVEITEEYPDIVDAYRYYLSYCTKGKKYYYTNLSDEILKTIPIWEDRMSTGTTVIDKLLKKYNHEWVIKRNYLKEFMSSQINKPQKFTKLQKSIIADHVLEFVILNTKETLYSRPHTIRYVMTILLKYYDIRGYFDYVRKSMLSELEEIINGKM